MDNKKIKYIIFDLGGVLIKIHPEKFFKRVFGNTDIQEEIIINQSEGMNAGDVSPQEVICKLKKQYNLSLPEKDIIESFKKDWVGELINPMMQLVEELIEKGYYICALSNTNKLHADHVSPIFNYYKGFYKVYFSFELHMQKPDKKIYEYVIKDLNVKPDEIFFIDDAEENVKAAASVGMQTIRVERNKPDIAEIKRILI